MNDRKRKSSCIHVLCDDLVLFRLRSKELSPVCTGTAFLFVDCHRSENQFQENHNTSHRAKNAKTWPSLVFVPSGHKNEAQSPCKNVEGRPICSPKISIPAAETKLACVLSYLENAIIRGLNPYLVSRVITPETFDQLQSTRGSIQRAY